MTKAVQKNSIVCIDYIQFCSILDDSWMNISPEELDSILAARFGFKDKVVNVTDDPQQITSKLMAFFNRQSDLDGVEEEEEP